MFARSESVRPCTEFEFRTTEPERDDPRKHSDGKPERSRTPGALGKGPIARTLLLLGVSAIAAAAASEALAQDAQLPPLTVEGTKPAAKKKAAAKKAPSAAPGAASATPVAAPVTAATTGVAPSEVPYTVPAGVSVVTGEELATYGNGDINNALRSQPGTFTRMSPQNAGLAVNIRGFEGSGRVNTSIDGARQNFRFTGHEAQGFAYIDPSLIAGVDIERGAVSTAGGAGALAGAADLRTLDVQDILLPGQTVGALTSTTWGTNHQRFTGLAAAAAQSAGVGIAGAVGRRNPTSYENADGVRVPLTFQDLYSGLFKANFQINEENSLRFGGVFYNNDFFANSFYQQVISNTFTAKYAYKPVDNDLIDFKLNGYRNEVTMKYGRGATGAWTSTSSGRVIDDEGWGFDASNVSRFRIGSVGVRSEYGYEYFLDDVDAYNLLQPAQGGGVNPSGKQSIGGLFSETTFSQSIFDLIVGLRYDMYDITGKGTIPALPNNPVTGLPQSLPAFLAVGPYSVDKTEERLNPKVTLAAQVLPWLQPYVTYSESSRAPTVSELLTGGVHPGGTSVSFLPNPFLDPEIQKGWEFGANVRQDNLLNGGDSFRLKADYYTMDVENYIVACGVPFVTGTAASPRNASANYFCNARGISTVQGVELQSMYDTGFAFSGLSYTYTKTDLPSQTDGFGAHSFLPEHTLVGTVGVRLLDEKLTLGTRVSYFSESYVGQVNVGAFYTAPYMPAYTVVDLFSSYKFNEGLTTSINVDNLFDESYTPALSTTQGFPGSPTCFGSNAPGCNTTGMGRTVYFTARAQF
jgi:hemoglobin/transferrin/lactoferrin receptor protein